MVGGGERRREKDRVPSKCPKRWWPSGLGSSSPSPSRPLALHLASSSGALRHGSSACVGGALAGTPLPEPLSRWLRGTAGAGLVPTPGPLSPVEVGRVLRLQLSSCTLHLWAAAF